MKAVCWLREIGTFWSVMELGCPGAHSFMGSSLPRAGSGQPRLRCQFFSQLIYWPFVKALCWWRTHDCAVRRGEIASDPSNKWGSAWKGGRAGIPHLKASVRYCCGQLGPGLGTGFSEVSCTRCSYLMGKVFNCVRGKCRWTQSTWGTVWSLVHFEHTSRTGVGGFWGWGFVSLLLGLGGGSWWVFSSMIQGSEDKRNESVRQQQWRTEHRLLHKVSECPGKHGPCADVLLHVQERVQELFLMFQTREFQTREFGATFSTRQTHPHASSAAGIVFQIFLVSDVWADKWLDPGKEAPEWRDGRGMCNSCRSWAGESQRLLRELWLFHVLSLSTFPSFSLPLT